MESFCVTTQKDYNGFIEKTLKDRFEDIKLYETEEYLDQEITHAIVFYDGEEFKEERNEIASRNIPARKINIKITRVINIKKEKEYSNLKSTSTYEYIGRNSDWGNPHSFTEGDDRDELIRKYEYDFERGYIHKIEDLYKLAGKRLGCFWAMFRLKVEAH